VFSDNTLTPKEAIRLCALGTLALSPLRYSELATAIRHFVGRIQGPNLEMMGSSIELLKFEGLLEAIDGKGMEDDATLTLTEDGRAEFETLLGANIRATATELNKLIIALKFRFLHLLERNGQRAQVDLLIDVTESEHARLDDLRRTTGAEERDGYLNDWLDHDIDALSRRIQWLKEFRARLDDARAAGAAQ
jgi:DNA-binding PadR family transcriptional regulator